jgi:hypothetical protein
MSLRMKSLAKLIIAASVLSAAALAVPALPASASIAPDALLYSASINSLAQNSNYEVSCTPGSHAISEAAVGGVIAAANGCGTRIWIHQNPDGSGWSYCISPYTYTTVPGWAYWPEQILVSANTAGCGAGSIATKFTLYGTQGDADTGCIGGSHGISEPGLFGVTAAANGCGTRVWLHQNSDGSGWSYCISPYTYTTVPGWAYWPLQLLVSSNTASC